MGNDKRVSLVEEEEADHESLKEALLGNFMNLLSFLSRLLTIQMATLMVWWRGA